REPQPGRETHDDEDDEHRPVDHGIAEDERDDADRRNERELHPGRDRVQPSAGGRDLAEELRARFDPGVRPPRRRGGASTAASGPADFVTSGPADARAFIGTVGMPTHGVSLMMRSR